MKNAAIWILGGLGWLVSYGMFIRYLMDTDWAFFAAWSEAFNANLFATGLLTDLCTVSVMMIVVAACDRRRLGPRWTAAVIACLALSVSMSLAVYLVGVTRGSGSAKLRELDLPQG